MLVTVAGERPYDAFRLLDEPLWKVLYVFHHLTEREASRALRDRAARVDAGLLTAMAVNEPKLLADELRDVQSAIRDHEDGPSGRTDAATQRAKGQALLERIRQGRALDPEALVS